MSARIYLVQQLQRSCNCFQYFSLEIKDYGLTYKVNWGTIKVWFQQETLMSSFGARTKRTLLFSFTSPLDCCIRMSCKVIVPCKTLKRVLIPVCNVPSYSNVILSFLIILHPSFGQEIGFDFQDVALSGSFLLL